ncbi:MAG: response regulator receiver protein [Phycisphaerae bacterium SM23_30]|nr:MAG: response regulator receiver protein [Phycisphaerae bacterium SM23_30]
MYQTILLIDDEPNVIAALKHALRRERYHILSAPSADEALEILDQESVDVVVSDEKMPGMSGSELLAVIRQKYPDTIRIILTGRASVEAAVRAINEGEVYRFLLKPCNGFDLAITIRRALQYKKLLSKSRQLVHNSRRQNALLQELEKRHPGITKIDRNGDGAIIVDELEEEFEPLMKAVDVELKKSQRYLPDKLSPARQG